MDTIYVLCSFLGFLIGVAFASGFCFLTMYKAPTGISAKLNKEEKERCVEYLEYAPLPQLSDNNLESCNKMIATRNALLKLQQILKEEE